MFSYKHKTLELPWRMGRVNPIFQWPSSQCLFVLWLHRHPVCLVYRWKHTTGNHRLSSCWIPWLLIPYNSGEIWMNYINFSHLTRYMHIHTLHIMRLRIRPFRKLHVECLSYIRIITHNVTCFCYGWAVCTIINNLVVWFITRFTFKTLSNFKF